MAYLVLFLGLLVAGGKPYYLAGMYPVLLAAGAAPTLRWVRRGQVAARRAAHAAAVLLSLAVNAVLMLPLLPARSLPGSPIVAIQPISAESIGWPELAATVSAVYQALPADQRAHAIVLARNYGEAGAIDTFRRHVELPPAYSGHNSYADWGPPPERAGPVIAVGFDEPTLRGMFGSVRPAARLDNGIGLANEEQGRPVWVCHDRLASWPALGRGCAGWHDPSPGAAGSLPAGGHHARYRDRVPHIDHTHGRIYLLRHGETEWSATGRHTSYTDVPLTDRGRELATASGRVLAAVRGPDAPPFALELTSPRRRAMDTAKLAKLTPSVEDSLVEWNYGDYEGLTTPQIRETVPGWTVWTHPSPHGETAEEVTSRANRVLDRCREVLTSGDVVLVGHGHFSRVLTARWLGLPASAGVGFRLDAGGLTVLGDERGEPRLDHVNLVELNEAWLSR